MTATAPITIPVSFINEAPAKVLAVDEAGFRKMMGYDQRSEAAAKSASWTFRSTHGIITRTGGVYLIADILNALKEESQRRRMN